MRGGGVAADAERGLQPSIGKFPESLKGWNSHVRRESPGKLESRNLCRDNLSREVGRSCSADLRHLSRDDLSRANLCRDDISRDNLSRDGRSAALTAWSRTSSRAARPTAWGSACCSGAVLYSVV